MGVPMLYWASDMATPSFEGEFAMVHGSNKAPSPSMYVIVSAWLISQGV